MERVVFSEKVYAYACMCACVHNARIRKISFLRVFGYVCVYVYARVYVRTSTFDNKRNPPHVLKWAAIESKAIFSHSERLSN